MLRVLASLLLLCSGIAGARSAAAQTVVCFGDSLTAGYGAQPGSAYPDFLQKDLATAGYHVHLVNLGIAGDTTKDGLDRVSSVLAAHPAIVILELGANDGLRGQPAAGTLSNLASMIRSFQKAHIRVLLLGMKVPPNLGPDYVRQFDSVFPALAAQYHLPLVPFLLQGVYGNDSLMSEDSIHPNGAGYRIVAQTVLPYLETMLRK
jgi:acyl-CoA thioesterase-1